MESDLEPAEKDTSSDEGGPIVMSGPFCLILEYLNLEKYLETANMQDNILAVNNAIGDTNVIPERLERESFKQLLAKYVMRGVEGVSDALNAAFMFHCNTHIDCMNLAMKFTQVACEPWMQNLAKTVGAPLAKKFVIYKDDGTHLATMGFPNLIW